MLPRIHMQTQTFLEMCRIESRYKQKFGLTNGRASEEGKLTNALHNNTLLYVVSISYELWIHGKNTEQYYLKIHVCWETMSCELTKGYQIFWGGCSLQNAEGTGTLWPPTYWPADNVSWPKRLQFSSNSSLQCVLSRSQCLVWQKQINCNGKLFSSLGLQHNHILCCVMWTWFMFYKIYDYWIPINVNKNYNDSNNALRNEATFMTQELDYFKNCFLPLQGLDNPSGILQTPLARLHGGCVVCLLNHQAVKSMVAHHQMPFPLL